MLTNEQLRQGLEEISASTAGPHDVDRVECVRCNLFTFHNSSYKYSAEIITHLKASHTVDYYTNYAEEWLKKFSVLTNSSWCHIARGYRSRLPFHRVYSCHFKNPPISSVIYNKVAQNIQKLVGGPPHCLGHIIFKFYLKNRKRKDRSSFITILIDNSYCKKLYIQNYFLELASGDKSWTQKYMCDVEGPPQDHSDPLVRLDEVYYRYFADGHTYRTAKILYQLTLLCEYGNNAKVLSDHTMNPTMSYVSTVYRHYKNYMKDNCINFEVVMSRKQAEMEQLGGLIRFQSQDMITIITPTMKRVLSSCELDEVIISSTVVSQGPTVTLFFIPSKVGALCFACVIHKTQEAYSKAFLTIKSIIEKDYTKNFKPKSVVISDISSTEQKIAAETVFQDSKVLIAPWSLCSGAWIWICNSKSPTKRYWHEAMLRFHDIMNATSTESAHVRYKEFVSIMGFTDLSFFKDYLEEIWKQYSIKIWWCTANNTLVALSIILLQQLFIQKCASFNIIHMCDVINTLDKHFQQILLSWVDTKQPILKIHSKFLDKCELNSLKLELTSPREFLVDNGFVTKLRTDTWCCDCITGRKALYCEHLCTLLDLADVTVELSCDEKRLLKHIADKNDTVADANGNCEEVSKVHPTYTDGYFLFNLPININLQFTYKWKSFDLNLSGRESYNLIINDLTEKYKSTTGFSEDVQDKCLEITVGLNKSVAGTGDIDNQIVKKLDNFAMRGPQQYTRKKQTSHVDDGKTKVTMDTESVEIQSNDLFEESDGQINNTVEKENEVCNNTAEKYINFGSHSKASLNHEIDLKIDLVHTGDDKADKNLLEDIRSEAFMDASSSVNNFEVEYNSALDNLRKEFKKLTDGLRLSGSGNKLERVVRLTKEFSTTRVELLNIKSEPEDHSVD